jgi:maltose alpha-D-glucosyltransferase/alpha-amylase
VWADERPKNHKDGIIFPGQQTTTWSLDRRAKKYYFHRFYHHQADLNTSNPSVRAEIQKIMGFWLQLGVSGFRMDAVPFLIEKKGPGIAEQKDFGLLKGMRDFLRWRAGDAILLGEANVPPAERMHYFGRDGERLQMMLNFPVNQRLFYAMATADLERLTWALAPEERMQLYGRGIRLRLAPMLGGDRTRLELAFSLLFSLPGTPMMQYGDEIGIGEDLRLPEREAARTPMQWTSGRHAGFSRARTIVRPVIGTRRYGYRRERCVVASRPAVPSELDRANSPRAPGVPGNQLGLVPCSENECSSGAGDAL